jgi:hypothetical protein
MGKIITLLLCLLFVFSSLLDAQYRINKTKYDYRTYKYQPNDRYNPTISGISSLFLPGLGQITSGETGRGIAFFAGFACGIGIYGIGSSIIVNELGHGGMALGLPLALIGIGCAAGIDIESVFDAVRVSKVNNLAFRDKNKTSINLQILPSIISTTNYFSSRPLTEISLKIIF